MEVPFISLMLLLELALSAAGPQNLIRVLQPADVTGIRGDSTVLNCTSRGRNIERFFSQWDFYRRYTHINTWTATAVNSDLRRADEKEKAFVVQHGSHTSFLVISDLQINDAGTYICSIKTIIPPPTVNGKGNGTTLRVIAPPKVLLSLSSADGPTLAVLVTCTLGEFYPAHAHVSLTSTCGEYQGFENHTVRNFDGTYSETHSALLNITGCRNMTEVTCFIKHDTGEWRSTSQISGMKNKAPPKVLLSLSSADGPTLAVLVTCTLGEFYPAPAHVTLTSTCGEYQGFENHTVRNFDGTYSETHSALLNIIGCRKMTEVTCFIKHDTGEWRRTSQISGMKNKGQRQWIPLECLIKAGVLAVFVLIVYLIFKSYNACCEKTKE